MKNLRVLILFVLIDVIISEKVPVYIWSKQSLETLPSVTALESINGKTFQSDYINPLLKDKQTLIVYVRDTLSLEDFSTVEDKKTFQNLQNFLDTQSSLLLPSVDDPSKSLLRLDNKYKIKQMQLKNSNIQNIPSAVENNDILLLKLPNSKDADRNNQNLDNLMKKVQEALTKVTKPVTFLLTGDKPSWDSSVDEMRPLRHLLETVDYTNGTLLNYSSCGLLYYYNATALIIDNSSASDIIVFNGQIHLEKEYICEPGNLSVTINTFISDGSENNMANFSMEFNITSREWYLANIKLYLPGHPDEDFPLFTSKIEAPTKFSYSCYKTVMHMDRNKTDIFGNITFDVFQVQPFTTKHENFADSFDCTTFFTIPTWMGFMVILLFTVILAIGVYMLFNIHTMDRFDDPKGKTISVPVAD